MTMPAKTQTKRQMAAAKRKKDKEDAAAAAAMVQDQVEAEEGASDSEAMDEDVEDDDDEEYQQRPFFDGLPECPTATALAERILTGELEAVDRLAMRVIPEGGDVEDMDNCLPIPWEDPEKMLKVALSAPCALVCQALLSAVGVDDLARANVLLAMIKEMLDSSMFSVALSGTMMVGGAVQMTRTDCLVVSVMSSATFNTAQSVSADAALFDAPHPVLERLRLAELEAAKTAKDKVDAAAKLQRKVLRMAKKTAEAAAKDKTAQDQARKDKATADKARKDKATAEQVAKDAALAQALGGAAVVVDDVTDEAFKRDMDMVGRWRTRQDAIDFGLRPVVAKVQREDGYASYAEYEREMQSLVQRVQRAVTYEVELGTVEGRTRATALMQVSCDLSNRLEKTVICKSMAEPYWEPQRLMVLHENKWSGGAADASTEDFAKKGKLLTIFQRLSKPKHEDESSTDPFARGGIFDRKRPDKRKLGAETRACHICKEVGHIARNCTQKASKTAADMVCRRCKEKGHMAAECDGVRKP